MPNIWMRLKEPANPVSWKMAGLMFLLMVVSYVGFSALSGGLRLQMRSAHSLYWTFTFPWSVGCMALLSAAARLAGKISVFLGSGSTGGSNISQGV